MKFWLKSFVLVIIAAAMIMIPALGANTVAAAEPVNTESAIVGSWITNFNQGKIQYHFHEDGCFHSHLEFKDEVSTFGEGTYSVSGNEVTLKFSRRIVNCDNEARQRIVLQRSAQLDVIKFTVNFTENGKRWNTNFGDYNVTFFEDEKSEAWAESHITSFAPATHKH